MPTHFLTRRAWCRTGLLALTAGSVGVSRRASAADNSVSELKTDERLVFFPTMGWFDEKTREWLLPVHGWVFEPEEDSAMRGVFLQQLQTTVGLAARDLSGDVFNRRARAFLVDNERNKEIVVRIAGTTSKLTKSEPDGHFRDTLRQESAPLAAAAAKGQLSYSAVLPAKDRRQFSGLVHLATPEGRTVVSDIDDTVKITEVGDKTRVLRNTLCLPFRAVPGMADTYQRWAARGTQFHWVSSSPWQLYEPLAEFFAAERFPAAAWRLKDFRLKDSSVLNLLADPEESKVGAIREIIQRYPKRKFTLVGDSGERDPEAYGRVGELFPKQVDQILIRDVTDQPVTDARYQRAWKNLAPGVASIFHDPASLKLRGE